MGRIHFPYFLGAALCLDPAYPSVSRANSPTERVLPAGEGLAGPRGASSLREGPELAHLPVKRCPRSKYLQSHYSIWGVSLTPEVKT